MSCQFITEVSITQYSDIIAHQFTVLRFMKSLSRDGISVLSKKFAQICIEMWLTLSTLTKAAHSLHAILGLRQLGL